MAEYASPPFPSAAFYPRSIPLTSNLYSTPASSERKEAEELKMQLRKERLKVFCKEPVEDGNTLVALPSTIVSEQQRQQAMKAKIDDILTRFSQ